MRAGENPRLPDDFKDAQAANNERYRSVTNSWRLRWTVGYQHSLTTISS